MLNEMYVNNQFLDYSFLLEFPLYNVQQLFKQTNELNRRAGSHRLFRFVNSIHLYISLHLQLNEKIYLTNIISETYEHYKMYKLYLIYFVNIN